MTGGWTLYPPRQTDVIILYICACIGIGGVVRCLLKNLTIAKIHLPYSAALLIVGILFGVISLYSKTLKETSGLILKMDPIDLMAILIPPFIFKTAFQVDIHILVKSCGQVRFKTEIFINMSAQKPSQAQLLGRVWLGLIPRPLDLETDLQA